MQALPCRLHAGGRRAAAGFPALNICWPRGFPPCGSCVSGRRTPSSPAALLFGPVAQGRAAPSDSTDAGVCRVLLLRRAQSPLSVAKPCIRLASANHPAPRGPERPALGCGLWGARACPRRTVSAVGRRGMWGARLALGGLCPPLGGAGGGCWARPRRLCRLGRCGNMQDDEGEIAKKRGDGGKTNVNLQN